MANERNPNNPYRANDPNSADAPYRTRYRFSSGDDDTRRAVQLDNELQPDPELAEGPASSGRIAMFAVGIAVVLGVVFYGLNNSTIERPDSSAPATAQNTAAPPGMRDVTPHANGAPGVTTGAATSNPSSSNPKALDPKTPPAPAPSGGTE